jgi:predicted CDP-diglyceride synthetase/phosphatidate cytidylyltransferase
MIDELKHAGIDLGLAMAGFAGSVLMSSKEAGRNLPRTLASLLGGAASANYVTPLILKLARLDGEPQYAYAAAFLLGFCGLRAVESISTKFFNESSNSNKRSR